MAATRIRVIAPHAADLVRGLEDEEVLEVVLGELGAWGQLSKPKVPDFAGRETFEYKQHKEVTENSSV